MKKNYFIKKLYILGICILPLLYACKNDDFVASYPQTTSIPIIIEQFVEASYVYGKGNSNIINDIPDVVAIAVDSTVGFEGGYGGKTGMDTIKILKSDIVFWPDTVDVGGYTISFEKFNKSNFKAVLSSNIVIAGPISDPGPTDLAGTYKRTANGFLIEIKKVFDGVYVIDNPGGAGVPAFPYLLYNHKSSTGGDELRFPNQTDPCGGGLMLVADNAPNGLKSSEYSASYPPKITATSPLTLKWKIFEFPSASASSGHTGAALCQWGLGVRTFEKQ